MIELGVPNFVTGSWQGLFAPAHTPRNVVTKINADMVSVLNTPEIRARLTEQGAEVVGSSPEHLGSLVKNQTEGFINVAKKSNIKPE